MFSQYFGQYLFNQGILSAEQLLDVMNCERSVHVKLGVLAINAHYMTAEQVEEVHRLQHTLDKRFGTIAVEKGYMTADQLEDLLQLQNSRHLSFSQAVVDRGYLSLKQLEQAMVSYQNDNQLSNSQMQALQTPEFDEVSKLLLKFEGAAGMTDTYHEYVDLFIRSVIRFLNDVPVLERDLPLQQSIDTWVALQNITGQMKLFAGIAADNATFLEIARRYSGEPLKEIDELARDSVGEFLNQVNGLFVVNYSDKKIDVELEPQVVTQTRIMKAKQGYSIPVKLSFGQIEIMVGAGNEY